MKTGILVLVGIIVLGGIYMGVTSVKEDSVPMNEAEEQMMDDKNVSEDMMKDDSDTMMDDMEKKSESSDMMDASSMMKGGYESYAPEKLALAMKGDVVLFFKASWCPTCRALDGDLKASLMDIPEGLTILEVDYDTETALKQTYGVTSQHTLVQVDAQGNQITKWSGGLTLETVLAKVQ